MESVIRRPAALFCISFVAIGFAGIHLSPAVRWTIAAVCAVLLAISLLGRSVPPHASLRRSFRIALLALLLGNVYFSLYTDALLRADIRRLDGQTAEISAVVEECTYVTAYMAEYRIRLQTADGEPAHFRVLLDTADVSLEAGDCIRTAAQFSAFEKSDAGFAVEQYYFGEGIRMRAEADDIRVIDREKASLSSYITELRLLLHARLRVSLGRDASALPAALLLGDRSQLAENFTRDFRRLGISHLLAISGLHFTLLLCSADRVLALFLPSRKIRLSLLALLGIFYTFLSGASDSVLRAGLMMLITYSAVFVSRREDMPTALGVAAFLICTLHPASYYSIGLQLSIAAMDALACTEHIRKRFPKKNAESLFIRFCRRIGGEFLMTTLVQLILLPLLCLYFGEASLLTPVAVLLFSPLIRLILYLTPLLFLFPHLYPLIRTTEFLTKLTEDLASAAASLRGITVPLTFPLCTAFAFLLTAACVCLLFVRGRRRTLITLSTFCLIAAGFGTYLTVSLARCDAETGLISSVYKKNDALVVVSDGKYLLCDMSDGSYSAMRAAYESARLHHATELEALLLTHLHTRHIRTFDRLSDATYVRALILPEAENEKESDIADSLIACAEDKGIPVYTYSSAAQSSVYFGDVCLQPQRIYISRSTHPILTLSVRTEECSAVYLGTSFSEKITPSTAADIRILGIHGPVYKKKFSLPPVTAEGTILLRGNSADFCETPLSGGTVRQNEETVFIPLAP